MAEVDILSPHYDDAVLSCWHQIEQLGTRVVTLFGGEPDSRSHGLWDRLTGTTDAHDTIAMRQAENLIAIADSPSTTLNLDFLDRQYTVFGKRNIDQLSDAVEAERTDGKLLIAAGGIGTYLRHHPDHVTTRKVGLNLLERGDDVAFFMDIPYSLPARRFDHWPERISTEKLSHVFNRDVIIEPHELNTEQQRRKQAAVRTFDSQFQMVNKIALGALNRADAYRWEAIVKLV